MLVNMSTAMNSAVFGELPKVEGFLEERQAEADKQLADLIMQGRMNKRKVPPAYWAAMPNDDVKEWCIRPTIGLILHGAFGTGKTHQACGILNWRMAGRFATLSDIVDECRGAIGQGISRTEVLEKYIESELLVIDDLGKEKPTDYVCEVLFKIVDGRMNSNKSTVVTTNFTAGELFDRIAQHSDETMAGAIISRLSAYTRIEITGKDRRRA